MDTVKELEHYRKLYGVGDVATRAYESMVKILEQQVEYLNDFKIKDNVESAKDKPSYDRAIKMFENMPEIVSSLHKLKMELNIEYKEEQKRRTPISPETIAKLKPSVQSD